MQTKEQKAAYMKIWREANKEKIAANKKTYYEANKDKIKAQWKRYNNDNKDKRKKHRDENKDKMKAYRDENKEQLLANKKTYYEANKDKIKNKNKKHRDANKEKIAARKKIYNNNNKDKRNTYELKRRKTDYFFNMKVNLRSRTRAAFKSKGYKKGSTTEKMLGISYEKVKIHIERQFTDGMNWENRSEWHIDHIIPLASATTEAELLKLCHYRNLQPLWAKDNISKGATIPNVQIQMKL